MKQSLSPEMTVKELLDRFPRLLQSFADLGLSCAGCPTEAFHSLRDVAKEYGSDPKELIRYFQRILDATSAPDGSKPQSSRQAPDPRSRMD